MPGTLLRVRSACLVGGYNDVIEVVVGIEPRPCLLSGKVADLVDGRVLVT